ncbi:MAG: cobalamin-dependent protein [Clostridia bacterium]|nr:cobalamin-dependent protein [Clostridia bacterium]
MKKVYFVQVGFAFDSSVYLPYATGCIAAYALGKADFCAEYELGGFIYKRDSIEEALKKIDSPSIVAFSNYTWNVEYNRTLAKRVKELYPDCSVIFGGHSVTSDSTELLNECDFVDYLSFGEGEEPFYNLAMALKRGDDLSGVDNIAYRQANGEPVCTKRTFNFDITDYPSPYTTGLFDEIVAEESVELLAVIETNRGCPYKCAYCDWSAKGKVRFFRIEKVKAELKWLSDNRIEYCFCADANFGMFKRDLEITDYIVQLKEKTGCPDVFRAFYDKNSDDNVFEICHKLNENRMDKGATMSYQSLSDAALRNVNRQNLTVEHFSSLVAKYNRAKIPTYSELILGLPGETYDSFCDGLCALLEAGQHNSVSVYYCEILPNSIMGSDEYLDRFNIEVGHVKFNHIHSSNTDSEVEEYSDIVMSTDTMSREMWVKSNLFSVCLQSFHSLGLLRCFAIYMRNEKGMSYRSFYNSLLDFIAGNPETVFGKMLDDYYGKLVHSFEGEWNYTNPDFGDVVWSYEEGMFLECIKNYDRFNREIMPFLESLGIEKDIFDGLLTYQREVLRRPFKNGGRIKSEYAFNEFFDSIYSGNYQPLQRKEETVTFTELTPYDNWHDYAKNVVWFGRRRGATLYTSDREMYKVE